MWLRWTIDIDRTSDDDVLGTDDTPAFYTIDLVRMIDSARRSDDEDTDVHFNNQLNEGKEFYIQ
jgi:hypothetical protein